MFECVFLLHTFSISMFECALLLHTFSVVWVCLSVCLYYMH